MMMVVLTRVLMACRGLLVWIVLLSFRLVVSTYAVHGGAAGLSVALALIRMPAKFAWCVIAVYGPSRLCCVRAVTRASQQAIFSLSGITCGRLLFLPVLPRLLGAWFACRSPSCPPRSRVFRIPQWRNLSGDRSMGFDLGCSFGGRRAVMLIG